jgi:hypothetical protein
MAQNPDDASKVSKDARLVYKLRGTAVHTGAIKSEENLDPHEITQKGMKLAARAVREVIKRGRMPDSPIDFRFGNVVQIKRPTL